MLRVAILAVFLLSSCSAWVGPAFYGLNEAVNPFPPGRYRLSGGEEQSETISWDGHHLLSLSKSMRGTKKELQDWSAIPFLTAGPDIFVLQMRESKSDKAMYGVLERRGDRYRADLPNCGQTIALARAAGAVIELNDADGAPTTNPSCVFSTRISLEAALRRYITERELLGVKIERVGN